MRVNFRLLKKQVKEKDKLMHDLKKENETLARDLLQVETSFKTFTATVNQEKKREERKIKKRDSKDFLNNMKDESKELCFECNFCDVKCDSVSKLQSHVRTCHMRNFSNPRNNYGGQENEN